MKIFANGFLGWDEDEVAGGGTRTYESPTQNEETELTDYDAEDNERYAHWVDAAKAEISRASGRPVVALCGKVWAPKHNPNDYPICPQCQKIYDNLGKNF